MGGLFDPSKLTKVPYQDEIIGPLAIAFLVVFGLGLVVSLVLTYWPPAPIKNHPLKRRFTRRHAEWFLWAFVAGLVCFGFRVMGLPFLGWRLWLYVSAIIVVAIAAYVLYLLRTSFPKELAAYEAQQQKRLYQQQNRRRPVGPNGQPVPRSSRAEKRRQSARGR
jgi:hypothetical protein